jgi:hypothetical protein
MLSQQPRSNSNRVSGSAASRERVALASPVWSWLACAPASASSETVANQHIGVQRALKPTCARGTPARPAQASPARLPWHPSGYRQATYSRIRPSPDRRWPNLPRARGERGTGAGTALVAELHRGIDAAGVEVTLLHHGQLNPLSVPFWAGWATGRCGRAGRSSAWPIRLGIVHGRIPVSSHWLNTSILAADHAPSQGIEPSRSLLRMSGACVRTSS